MNSTLEYDDEHEDAEDVDTSLIYSISCIDYGLSLNYYESNHQLLFRITHFTIFQVK